jgi:uncharacterized Fe-S center protein
MPETEVFFKELAESSSVADKVDAMNTMLKAVPFGNLIKDRDKVAVKIHVGENKNKTFVPPAVIKTIIGLAKEKGGMPFLIETQTLYKGRRSNAIDHLNLAYEHGFTPENVGAPFIMADGLFGDNEIEVEIPGEIYTKVSIAREALLADVIVFGSHPTGHLQAGLGATLKNIGMGLASRKGKLRQHSSVKPFIKTAVCTNCGKCIRWCPEDAVIEKKGKAFILKEKCIGCGECLAVCPQDAVAYDWGVESEDLQKRMVEHALGIVREKRGKLFFFNFLFTMTRDCDCMDIVQQPLIPDIGILASADPVAIDQATLDLTFAENAKNLGRISFPNLDPEIQLRHGEKLGLGSRKYKLIKI